MQLIRETDKYQNYLKKFGGIVVMEVPSDWTKNEEWFYFDEDEFYEYYKKIN